MTSDLDIEQGEEAALAGGDDLDAFCRNNPLSSVSAHDGRRSITSPWGDASLEIVLDPESGDLINDLNLVILPPRLTAIIHLDADFTEFLGSIAPRSEQRMARKFTFALNGREYICRFGESSERAKRIALASNPVGAETRTNYRNTSGYHMFRRMSTMTGRNRSFADEMTLFSFYVSGLPHLEPEYLDVLQNLNFYITYLDRHSPRVLIHDEIIDEVSFPESADASSFPNYVTGHTRPAYLLTLWESVQSTEDSVRKLLHSYQILEYGAFYFVSSDIRADLDRILSLPDVRTTGSAKVMDLLPRFRMDDETKMDKMVNDMGNPERLWREIESHQAYFERAQPFEGGFEINALIKSGCTFPEFEAEWHPKVIKSLRKVRNAVVHAREQRQGHSIAPTETNLRKLAPWAHLAMALAGDIVLRQPADPGS